MSTEWDARYAAAPEPWGTEPNATVRERLEPLPPGHVVDLACGHGRNALWLARQGWRVTAVDHSAVALGQARARAADLGLDVEWVLADIRVWRPAHPVDVAVVSYLHVPMPELVALLRSVATWLRADGRLLYVGHSRTNRSLGVGGPSEPGVLPEIADLAGAAEGLRTVALHHVIQPTGAISIMLEAARWPASPTAEPTSPTMAADADPARGVVQA